MSAVLPPPLTGRRLPPATEFANLEDHLSVLSERWNFTLSWTEERERHLAQLQHHWPRLHEQLAQLKEWVDGQEARLKGMEAEPTTEQQALQQQGQQLQVRRDSRQHVLPATGVSSHGYGVGSGALVWTLLIPA